MENTKVKVLKEEIGIPKGIEVKIVEQKIIIKKNDKELIRKLNPLVNVGIESEKIVLTSKRSRRIEKKIFGTMKAHIKNMIKGLEEGFDYKLQISNVHFPMSVSHDKENNAIVVKNFLGEKIDRKIKILNDVEVKVDKEFIELNSFDIDKAGQSAANIEKGTRVRNKDRRIFQDGIFIIKKPGRSFV